MGVLQSVLDRGIEQTVGLNVSLNAPEFFEDPAFVSFINRTSVPVATWHGKGAPAGEYSDTFLFVEPCLNGEGDSQGVPEHIWNTIIEALRLSYGPKGEKIPAQFRDHRICVRITNLAI